MLDAFFQAICKVGVFLICAQAIVHFKPKEDYEKYLKLLVSVMVLIQLSLPVGSLFARGGGQETARQLEEFRESLEEELRLAEEQAAETQRQLEEMTLEEVRKRVEEQRAQTDAEAEQAGAEVSQEEAEQASAEVSQAEEPEQRPEAVEAGQQADGGISVEVRPVEPILLQDAE